MNEIETILDSYKSICAVCEEKKSSCEKCCCGILIRAVEKQIAKPIEEWDESYGDCLWWKFPIEEPPYCGSPLDFEWIDKDYDNYYTHFTKLDIPILDWSAEE